MGAFLDKPKTEKHSAHGEGNGLRYGLSSMQGWRVEMEDAHTAVVGLPHGLTDWSFFAVYDGHAGSRVANYCSGHLLDHILGTPGSAGTPGGTGGTGAGDLGPEGVKDGIRAGFLKIDEYMRSFSDLRQGLDRSGSTAVGVLLSPAHLYFINCGDSRAVLCREGRVGFSTQDHKPCNPREKERIQNAGGSVMIQRVNGSLAVSRALGDYDYKCVDGKGPTEQLVSPEPEVGVMERAHEGDEFVVLACDGIWDVMSNEELCEFVRSRLQVCDDLEKVCNAVVDTCLHKGSRDNMSVVLVCLPGSPKVSEEAVRKEEELDKFIETRVEELLQSGGEDGVPDLVTVVRSIATENIPNLPPGGGLASKRSVIEAVYHKLNPHREEEGGVGERTGGAQSKEKGSTRAVLLEALRQIHVGQAGQDARTPLAYALANMARRPEGSAADAADEGDEEEEEEGSAANDEEEEEGTPFADAVDHSCRSAVCCSEDHREPQPAASPPPPSSPPSSPTPLPSSSATAEPEPKPSRDAAPPTATTTTAAPELLDHQPDPSASP